MLRFILPAILLPLWFAVLAPHGRFLHPALDSVGHFWMHLTILLIAASAVAWIAGLRRPALAGLAISAAAFAGMAPVLLPGMPAATAAGQRVKIVQFNARFDNAQIDKAAAFIRSTEADVVMLQEATDGPNSLARLLGDRYPLQVRCPSGRLGGSIVLSALPVAGDNPNLCSGGPFLSALRLTVGGKTVTFASLHLRWPWPHSQKRHVRALASFLGTLDQPLVLTGDFNAAPWSATVEDVAAITRTRPAAGYRPSWLTPRASAWMRTTLGLPIDHILVSKGISVRAIATGPEIGSDHLPVVAELEFPARP